ncbi:hypothetical protein HH311_19730 [Actinomycetospora sp. TBRC 11914]|nr:hypothetical protein [Actinomycetospora sp. TBRC 11914]
MSVLLAAVRDDGGGTRRGRRRGLGGRGRQLPDQPRRALREGPQLRRAARPPRPADDAAGPRLPARAVPRGHVGRGPGPGRDGAAGHPAAVRSRRGRPLRRRRDDQREGLPGREVRPRRAAQRLDRLQRPLLHVLGRRRGDEGLRRGPRDAVPARRHRPGRHGAARGVEPGRHHAPGDALVRRGPGAGGDPPRRRPPLHRQRRGGRRPPPAGPGHRPGAGQRPAAPRDQAPPRRHRVRRRADHRVGRRATGDAPVLAGPGGADHRRAGPRHGARGPAAGRVPRHHDPLRSRRRAARARLGHRAGVDQPRARPRAARPAVLGLGDDDRPGQRAGRARARPEGRPAARLPHAGRPGGPRARRRRLGRRSRRTAAPRRVRLRDARPSRHRRRGAGADGHGVQRRRVRPAGRPRPRAPRRPGPPRRLRPLPLRDGRAGRRRPALHPVGGGGGDDDQRRGAGAAAAPRGRGARRGALGSRRARRPRRAARPRAVLLRRPADGLRRAAPGLRGREGRLRRHLLGPDRGRARRVLAVPRRGPSRHPAHVPRRGRGSGAELDPGILRHARRPGPLPRRAPPGARRDPRRRVPLPAHHRPVPGALPVGHPDPAHQGAARRRARTRRRDPSRPRRPARGRRRRRRAAAQPPRPRPDARPARLDHPRRHRVRAVPLGRRADDQRPDQPGARPGVADARVQGLRGGHHRRARRRGHHRMMTTPRFLQGAFAFEGQGLEKPAPLHPSLTYTVPEGVTGQVLYVRAGNSSDELAVVVLVFDGAPARWLPVGAKADMHVSLRVVEDLLAGSTVEVHFAAPTGTAGTLVVDCGLVEV